MDNKTKRYAGWSIVVIAIMIAGYLGIQYPVPPPPEEASRAAGNVQVMRALAVTNDTNLGGALTVGGASTLTGNVTTSSTVQAGLLRQGTNYPVVNATPGKEFASGVVVTPVQVATVPASAHGLSTVEAVQCYPVSPLATGAWGCIAKVGANNQFTVTLVTLAATPVPTAAYGQIRWMAAGK